MKRNWEFQKSHLVLCVGRDGKSIVYWDNIIYYYILNFDQNEPTIVDKWEDDSLEITDRGVKKTHRICTNKKKPLNPFN